MTLSTISLVIFIALCVVGSAKQKEICSCVPLNICPDVNRFSKEDAKYFKTVLKCNERGFVRCCLNNEGVRRSDDVENVILIDEVRSPPAETPAEIEQTNEAIKFATTPESFTEVAESTTVESDHETTTFEATNLDDLSTTELPAIHEDNGKSRRKPKFIDNSISVIYPNHKYPEAYKKKKAMEHLFLIFPNGEIEAALATSSMPTNIDYSSEKPIKRVIVRKRLIKNLSDSLEGAESKISESVVEPKQMDIEEVKKRLSDMYRNRRTQSSSTTSTITEAAVEDTTAKVKKERKKEIRFRKQRVPTKSTPLEFTETLKYRSENAETSTKKSRRKIIYDTRSRTNFLKRPSSQPLYFDDDEPIEPEVTTTTTTTEQPAISTASYVSLDSVSVTRPKVVKHFSEIDFEHKVMIETVHKTLSAIHAGVDMKFVEKMLEAHRTKMQETRKRPPTTVGPSKPYRGSARFRKPATTQRANQQREVTGTRTRNISRTRNTASTAQTTIKPVRKSQRTFVTQNNPITTYNAILEDVDMPPKQKAPVDFKPSPLYGITMDRHSELDNDTIEKIHETLMPSTNIQNGFFPVVHNGTPSTLL